MIGGWKHGRLVDRPTRTCQIVAVESGRHVTLIRQHLVHGAGWEGEARITIDRESLLRALAAENHRPNSSAGQRSDSDGEDS